MLIQAVYSCFGIPPRRAMRRRNRLALLRAEGLDATPAPSVYHPVPSAIGGDRTRDCRRQSRSGVSLRGDEADDCDQGLPTRPATNARHNDFDRSKEFWEVSLDCTARHRGS